MPAASTVLPRRSTRRPARAAWLVTPVVTLMVTLVAAGLPAVAGEAAVSPVVDPEVRASLERGPTRVIVTLHAEPVRGRADSEPARRTRRALVRTQAQVLDAVPERLDLGARRAFERSPAVALTVERPEFERLLAQPEVASVTLDRVHRPAASANVTAIEADRAWASGLTGAGQAVAIIDTGVDKNHPYLTGKVVAEACFTTNAPSRSVSAVCPGPNPQRSTAPGAGLPCPFPSTDCRHGTHVAGIVAGSGGPAVAPEGVAPDARLIAIQVFSRFESESDCGVGNAPCAAAFDSDIIAGLDYVASLVGTLPGLSIAAANLSLGGGPSRSGACDDEPHKPSIDALRALGVATVVASGNGSNKSGLHVPACVSSAVSVGATTQTGGSVPGYSNSAPPLRLLAPGSTITSSVPGGSYLVYSGTSMATPHVSAAFALLRQARPTASVTDLLALLRNTGRPLRDSANGLAVPIMRLATAVDPPTVIPIAPTRVLDTRISFGAAGPIGAGQSVTLDLSNALAAVVPTGRVATGVVLNVTAVAPSETSFVTVFPAGYPRPLASNLNLAPGVTRANLVLAKLGAADSVTLFNNSGSTQLVADLTGWFDAGGMSAPGGRLVPNPPTRVLDTRDGTGGVTGVVPAGGSVSIDPRASCALPAGKVRGVVLNVTATGATAATHVTTWPAGLPRPVASSLNLGPGSTVPNLVMVPVGPTGRVALFNNSGTVHLVADLAACIDDGTAGSGRMVTTEPARILDTRNATGAPLGAVPAGGTITVTVAGRGGIPAVGASAVVLNVTATEATATTHVTVWPTGSGPAPTVSNLNLVPGSTTPNVVVVPIGTGGAVSLRNNSGTVHLIADVAGWVQA